MEEPSFTQGNNYHQSSQTNWKLVVIISLCAFFLLFVPIPLDAPKSTDKVIHIDATSFQFTPAVVKVNPGDRVTVEFISTDVVHGIFIDGYDFQLTSDPGQLVTATFIAAKPGMFRIRCSVPCGNLHPFIIGKLQVGPNLILIRAVMLGILAIVAAIVSLQKTAESKTGKML